MAKLKDLVTITARNTDQLVYQVPAGYAALLKSVQIAADQPGVAVIKTGQYSALGVFIGPEPLSHASMRPFPAGSGDILRYLKEKAQLSTEIPVQQGQNLTIQAGQIAQAIYAELALYDAADYEEMPNKPRSEEQFLLLYGTNKNEINTSGPYRLDKAMLPAEFRAWPWEAEACPYDEFDVLGVGVTAYEVNVYSGGQNRFGRTVGVSLWHNRERILAETHEVTFITLGAGASVGTYNEKYEKGYNVIPFGLTDAGLALKTFDQPLKIRRGEEFYIEVLIELESEATIMSNKIFAVIAGLARRV